MLYSKTDWLNDFRYYANSVLASLSQTGRNQKEKASKINKSMKDYREEKLEFILKKSHSEKWDNERILNEIMCMTYASYIAMLEFRNKVWPYEYMTFARRIGELWEPFCRLPFEYPVKELRIIEPPKFKTVQEDIIKNATTYINSLQLSTDIKNELEKHYSIPWTMVDSGGIKLALDLHFEQDGIHYNCDFKSGFSSNEKGNTNRLLLVASIYNSLGAVEKTLLFVRQNEDENNHYLQRLKKHPYWDVYCANDCYEAIKNFTGFDLRNWLDITVDWKNDISADFKQHLQENDLLKYLTW